MLTDEEKEKIKAEEIYRSEVQTAIKDSSAKPFSKSFKEFLNSPFGLWVLTSIVLSLFSFGYTQWTLSRDVQERIEKLDTEITERLMDAQYQLQMSAPQKSAKEIFDLLCLPPGGARTFQSEFSERNLESLLFELKSKVPVSEREQVSDAISHVQSIRIFPIPTEDALSEKTYAADALRKLHYIRWFQPDSPPRPEISLLEQVGPSYYLAVLITLFSVLAALHSLYGLRKRLGKSRPSS